MLPTNGDAEWIPAGTKVIVGSHTLTGGLLYVGERLAPQNGWGQQDNCLVMPSLPIAGPADAAGETLDHWPSYERLTPAARLAYLDWLATDRSEPKTPIGYVFLYFYGLERRLMLDRSADDRTTVVAEVERLLSIYGANRSFQRYASELLGAALLPMVASPSRRASPIGLAEVPTVVKLELGRHALDGRPIPAQLLLEFAANHPETRLRAAVRRLPELAARRFVEHVSREHPGGVPVVLPEGAERVPFQYRAASGTFTAPILPTGRTVPDVTVLAEPLGYGRRVLDSVASDLEPYWRVASRGEGTGKTLGELAQLPHDLRRAEAERVAAQPLARLDAVAASGKMFRLADLLDLVGLKANASTKMGLRDLSRCLAAFGLGVAPDPHFVPRIIETQEGVLVFRLPPDEAVSATPSERYRLLYLHLALGLVVARADGALDPAERRHLYSLVIEEPEISAGERRRLVSDFLWLEANPMAVSDLKRHLRDASPEARQALMTRLVPIAAADGKADPVEIEALEKLAKTLGLARESVYDRLAGATASADQPVTIEPAGPPSGQPVPPPPAARPDAGRLDAVRANTAKSAALLDGIFAEDDPAPLPVPPPSQSADLDTRHRAVLEKLRARDSWGRTDFERIVREQGLMPASALSRINEWSLDQYDEQVLEGDDPIIVNKASILEGA